MERPRLKAHFHTEVVDREKVFLIAEEQHYLIQGEEPVALLPLLDGRSDVVEIVQQLAGRIPLPRIITALRRYEAAGYLAEGHPGLPDSELAFWDAQGVDPAAVAGATAAATVVLTGVGGVETGPVAQALRDCGLQVTHNHESAAVNRGTALLVVVAEDYLDPALAQLNEIRLASGRPWLLAKPNGVTPWLGPYLQPGHTGCWACMAQRISENRQVERYLMGKRGDLVPRNASRAMLPAGQQAFAGLLATEVLRIAATGTSAALAGRMITLDLTTLQTTEHALVLRPQCTACGDPRLTAERGTKIVLTSRPARHSTDGGYRIQPPQLTFDRLKHHISPYLGAVSKLGAHEETSNGVTYSFTAGHNFAMVNDNMDLLRRNMRGQSGGKGRFEIQAKVSAVCEAIERYSAVWRGGEPVVRAAYDDLDPAIALHMKELLLFSDDQVAGRDAWNADPTHRLHLVPEPFRTDLPLDWSAGWSLTHDTERLVPTGYVWYGHPDLARHFYCVGDSNGGASGNTLEEAVLQGFCEVVERDAVALWWYNRLRRPAFDLDSLQDQYVNTLRGAYAAMDRDLWMLDITSDLGIPAFAALSHREHEVQDIMVGFGAHPDPAIAAMRALTEVNQFLPFVDRRDADGNTEYRTDDLETLGWCRQARLENEPWLRPDPTRPATDLGDFTAPAGDDLAGNIQECVARAKAAHLEVIVLDQTQPDLDLCVVKVIVPGMRHFWRRLGPGRLYDVPVRTGQLAQPTTEERMNRWNVFF
jgi:bacteriocin biosynthesis cyclodehydratase domain-containing protein